jgi:hypothetical protein
MLSLRRDVELIVILVLPPHWNSVDRLSVARQLGVTGVVRIVARQAAARRLQRRR